MGDEALGVAEIVGDVDKAKRVHHAKRARLSAGDLEGHQRAAALHLALRQRRLRVARQAWVEHLGDTVLALQELRSEEHTSELQSLMRISYAVFCLKKKKHNISKQAQHTDHNHK